ncbi:MAG TPA: hypothetical protein VHV75_03895 [Solirubrobacteraceae bacterium]|nr:hypothetical protein [Solirubrobacteraceae bacterium]
MTATVTPPIPWPERSSTVPERTGWSLISTVASPMLILAPEGSDSCTPKPASLVRPVALTGIEIGADVWSAAKVKVPRSDV